MAAAKPPSPRKAAAQQKIVRQDSFGSARVIRARGCFYNRDSL